MHPIACQVDLLIRNGDFGAAEDAIMLGLEREPRNPDLIAAQGLVLAYTGKEDFAIDLLGRATLSPLGRRLAQVLAAHLISRQKLSTKTGERDLVAHAYLTKVRMQTNQPIDRVGVDISAWVDANRSTGDLSRCLGSLQGRVDEIVVYCERPTQEATAIAKRFGVKITSSNSPLTECASDWILRVDVDEELGPEAANALKKAVGRPHFSGFEACVEGTWSLRLVRRGQDLEGYPVARIDESVISRFASDYREQEPMKSNESPDEILSRCDLTDEMGIGGSHNEFERALALFKLGEIEDGLAASARCLAIDWPADLDPVSAGDRYALRGKLLAASGDLEAAAEVFELAVQACPEHDEARLEWARAWERLGKYDAALSVYMSGQESESIGVACLAGAGRTSSRLGLPKRSADLFREAWRRNPGDPSAWMAWVEASVAYGDPAGIVEAYGASGETPTLPATGFSAWASAHRALGDLPQAAEKYRLAIAQPDASAEDYFALADVCVELKLDTEAAERLESGLSIEPNHLQGWLNLGLALHRLGLIHGARISCQRALAIDPDCTPARQLLDSICQAA